MILMQLLYGVLPGMRTRTFRVLVARLGAEGLLANRAWSSNVKLKTLNLSGFGST